MNGRAAKAHRKTAVAGATAAVQAVAPAIEAALGNEQKTRERVEALEALLGRPFWGRLRWLLSGK